MTYKPILFSIFKKYIAKDKYKNSLFPFKRKIQEKKHPNRYIHSSNSRIDFYLC